MANSPRNIIIVGAGQLGSRYMQGLATYSDQISIHVVDPSTESLLTAKKRWHEIIQNDLSPHQIQFYSKVPRLDQTIDIAVVSTTANARVKAVKTLVHALNVNYFILEKVLCQSTKELDELTQLTEASKTTWVNTIRQATPWYQKIKRNFNPDTPITLTATGGSWGLACNSVHFLDLLAWLSGEFVVKIDSVELEKRWKESKRHGFSEVHGTLVATYSGGSKAILTSKDTKLNNHELAIQYSNNTIFIDEAKGVAIGVDGREIRGRIPLQSEMTAAVVESILKKGACKLPLLSDSAISHKILLSSLLAHYQKYHDSKAILLPIT